MRTTIEIRDDQRARLLEIAARRGEKGFSGLVQEALDRYLDELAAQESRITEALGVLGSLGEDEATHMEQTVLALRGSWR
jgi:hypothetical protein